MNMKFQEGDIVRLIKDSPSYEYFTQQQNAYFVVQYVYGTYVELSIGDHTLMTLIDDIELVHGTTLTNELPKGIEGKKDLNTKPHLAYLDPHLEYEMGMGMRYGAHKHGWNNHRNMDASASQHILDSLKRHLNAYLRGEEIDKETGVNHLACLMNNCNFLYRLNRIHGYDNIITEIYGVTK